MKHNWEFSDVEIKEFVDELLVGLDNYYSNLRKGMKSWIYRELLIFSSKIDGKTIYEKGDLLFEEEHEC